MTAPFYAAVLPRSGQYAIFNLGTKQHTWADTADKLERKIALLHANQGIYFATASYSAATQRTQSNVALLRSLRLDIDAGTKKFAAHPDAAYPTQPDALAALIAFTRLSNLVPSYIVSSGEGLHVYYCLDEDIVPAAWVPLAARLGQLCVEHGLKTDPTVTNDTARILRPPGMLHPNGQRVSVLKETGKVYNIGKLRIILGVAAVEADPFAGASGRFSKASLAINQDVARTVEGPPKSILKIIESCGALRQAANAKGDVPEPYWRAMIGITKFTVEGDEAAHMMSEGYDGYDYDETQRKYDAYTAGPPSCAEFSKHTEACTSCPQWGKIKSPIQLGYLTDKQVAALPVEQQPQEPAPTAAPGMPWDGCLPARFQVIGKPGAYTLQYTMKVTKEDDSGAQVTSNILVPVTHDIFWFGHWAEASNSKDLAQVSVHIYNNGRVNTYLMDQSLAAGSFDLLKWLAGKGIHKCTDKKAAQAMQDFSTLMLQRIKNIARRPKISGRFGLRINDDGSLMCAHGNYVINADGTIQEAMLSDELSETANSFAIPLPHTATGEWAATVWGSTIFPAAREYVAYMKKMYEVPGLEKYQLAAMLGLASPLMAFVTGSYTQGIDLPPNALSVSLYSKGTGQGKTALLQAVTLAFGHPDRLVMVSNQSGSTDIGRLERLSVSGTFPTCMDEMGNTKELSITNMISAVANAKGKTRSKQSGGFTTTKSWALINLITTNRSQREMVSVGQTDSPAIQFRLLELDVEDVIFTKVDRDSYIDAWAEVTANTKGALGAVINYALCRLGAVRLNIALVEAVKEADGLLQAEQGARFQYRALGALLFLQKILVGLKMDMFDRGTLVNEFKKAYSAGVQYIAENVLPSDGATLMGMCLSDLKPRTLITENETNRAVNRTIFDVPLNSRVPDHVDARHITSTGFTYVSVKAVHDWCVETKASEREMIHDCKSRGILVPPSSTQPAAFSQQLDLFKGMREAEAVRTRAYKVNTRLLTLAGGITLSAAMAVLPVTTEEIV